MKDISYNLTRDEINREVWKGILIGLTIAGFVTALLFYYHHVRL